MAAAPLAGGARNPVQRGRALRRAAPALLALIIAFALRQAPAAAAGTPPVPTTSTPTATTAPPTATSSPPAQSSPPYAIKPKPRSRLYDVTTRFAIANVDRFIYRRPNMRSGHVSRPRYYTPDVEALQTYRLVRARRVGRTLW